MKSKIYLRPGDPYQTQGLFFIRNFIDKYGFGRKRWIKKINKRGGLEYHFDSIYYEK